MTDTPDNDTRHSTEDPAEGAVHPGEHETPEREHPQDPAEGPDDESAQG